MADRAGFFRRVLSGFIQSPTPKTTEVAKAVSSAVPVNSYNVGYSFGMGGYAPHEPFTQAWQKNMEGKSYRDPVMLAFSAVYACVTIISQDLSKLPINVRIIDPKDNIGTANAPLTDPYQRLLRKPNDYQTSLDFQQYWSACKLIRGNAYAFKELDGRGVPTAMHILHPDRVRVLIEPVSKEVYYQYQPHMNDMVSFEKFGDYEGTYLIPSRFIIHDRINCLWHPLIGVSPMFAAAVSTATGARILMNSERLFGNMARPSGILSAPGEINDVTAQRLKREFEANYSAGNIGRTAVLGDGLEWKAMTLTGVEAQLIEQLKWTIEDVARVFRVPMYLLNDMARMTYKNSEHAAQSYYSGCLQYHAESTEARFTLDFGFDETSKRVEFDVAGMFRMDTKERFEAYNAGITGGHLSPNEAREMEGRGPVKGGEEPRMQMQYVPLSTPVPDPTAAEPAPAPAAPAEDGKEISEAAHDEMLAIIARMAGGAGRIQQCREGMTQ